MAAEAFSPSHNQSLFFSPGHKTEHPLHCTESTIYELLAAISFLILTDGIGEQL